MCQTRVVWLVCSRSEGREARQRLAWTRNRAAEMRLSGWSGPTAACAAWRKGAHRMWYSPPTQSTHSARCTPTVRQRWLSVVTQDVV